MRIDQNRHLTFCTNIFPGRDWETTYSSLRENLPVIKQKLCPDANFGLGLRLGHTASKELGVGRTLSAFKDWLDDQGIYVFTMNGFPYGNFHDQPVKDQVHAPDWTTGERVKYTERLAEQLAFLLPKEISGGISTSPISYKHWHKPARAQEVLAKGAKNLIHLVIFLRALKMKTGKHIHIDLEPEPDGMLENSDEVLNFFNDHLIPQGVKILGRELNLGPQDSQELIREHLQVCYDICHFSLAYENPATSLQKLLDNGIKIGKIQISSALKVRFDHMNDPKIWSSLARFNEPTYLHQVTLKENGKITTYRDLPMVLSEKRTFHEIRAHFHVPIFLEKFAPLESTQEYILETFEYLNNKSVTEHLEVETYTWEVLPGELKMDLNPSIVRELQWVLQHLDP